MSARIILVQWKCEDCTLFGGDVVGLGSAQAHANEKKHNVTVEIWEEHRRRELITPKESIAATGDATQDTALIPIITAADGV